MPIDPTNRIVELCAAGMAVAGTPVEARRLFAQAWAEHQDDYEACIAAHFVARHQPTPAETVRWNEIALQHAMLVPDNRAEPFMASLYLNLADAYARVGEVTAARETAARARAALDFLPREGYRAFLESGLQRLELSGMLSPLRLSDPEHR